MAMVLVGRSLGVISRSPFSPVTWSLITTVSVSLSFVEDVVLSWFDDVGPSMVGSTADLSSRVCALSSTCSLLDVIVSSGLLARDFLTSRLSSVHDL